MFSKSIRDLIPLGTKETFGLDIGSSSIKLVQLKEGKKGYVLSRLGMIDIPPEAIVDGSIIDAPTVVDAIGELVKTQGIKAKNVAFSISGHSVIIKRVNFPVMSEDELAESIQWEAEQYIPFDINDVNIDFQIIGTDTEGKGQMEVLLVACKKEVVSDYTHVIMEAGLNPVVADIDSFTLENMFEINYPVSQEENIVLVNIGASVTNINILKGGLTFFTRDISIGGNQFTEELQKGLNLNFQDAEILKKGGEVEGRSYDEAKPIIEKVIDQVASEVKRTIDFFLSTSIGDYISKIYIGGGTSKFEALPGAIQDKTGMPTEMVNPLNNISYNPKQFEPAYIEDVLPFIGVGIGLAVRRMGDK